ncbi:MAG: TetR/AcrR family transcriptional regulator [Planctomycetota bacterium]
MSRPIGSTNQGFDEKRTRLLTALREALFSAKPPMSFRGLAAAVGVSVPTLRHYFGDRDRLIVEVLRDCHRGAAEELEITAVALDDLEASVAAVLAHISAGFDYGGLTQLNRLGLTEGMSGPDLAAAYLAEVLEPTIRAIESRLKTHIRRGQMRDIDPRFAALQLISPVLMVYLHQDALNGKERYPLDRRVVLDELTRSFCRAHAPED